MEQMSFPRMRRCRCRTTHVRGCDGVSEEALMPPVRAQRCSARCPLSLSQLSPRIRMSWRCTTTASARGLDAIASPGRPVSSHPRVVFSMTSATQMLKETMPAQRRPAGHSARRAVGIWRCASQQSPGKTARLCRLWLSSRSTGCFAGQGQDSPKLLPANKHRHHHVSPELVHNASSSEASIRRQRFWFRHLCGRMCQATGGCRSALA